MYIKEAIKNIQENNLTLMKENFRVALTEKAIQKIEEKKIKVAQSFFEKK